MKYTIKDNQAGFVLKDGIFKKMITAGTYHFSKTLGYEVEIEEMTGELDYIDVPYQVLSKDKEFLNATIHMEIPDGSVGFLYVNGKLTSFAGRKEYTYWNVFDKYEIKVISMEETLMGEEVNKQMVSLIPKNLYTKMLVGEGEAGLVYYDNVLQKQLSKGIYRFWNFSHTVSYRVFDMKQRELDIVGQEILTKDKIGIRMNVACMFKVRDAVEFAEKISGEIFQVLKGKEDMFCVNFLTAGIKDIILPGEIRDIMNSVLVAEKTAQANVISRREEVASTRSLLNTAKLMDENTTLYKLKELEYLERICGKVGEISVNGNAGIVEQLGKIMGFGQAV